jgi:hypothetical protein
MLYFDFRPSMKYLTREQKGDLLEAIYCYGQDEIEPEFDDIETQIVWSLLKQAIERDAGRYQKVISDRKAAAQRRWGKSQKATPQADATDTSTHSATQADANDASACSAMQADANDASACFAMQTMPTTSTTAAATAAATTPTATTTAATATTPATASTTAPASTSTNTITRASAAAAAAATTTQKEKENAAKPPRARFAVPDEAQVISFFVESGDKADEAGKFYDYYASNGWVIGKSQMKDWQAAARNWMRRSTQYESAHKAAASGSARPTQTTESFIEQMRRVTGQIEPL